MSLNLEKTYVVNVENEKNKRLLLVMLGLAQKYGVVLSDPVVNNFRVSFVSNDQSFRHFFLDRWIREGLISSFEVFYVSKSKL